jgi:FAD/FMN-containing dehydrogenase
MDDSHAVIAPSDEQAVGEALATLWGAEGGVHGGERVVVRGAGMHSPGASSGGAPEGGQTLSLARLARVLDVDTRAGVVVAEAGVTVAALEHTLRLEGLTLARLGPLPAAATIGGLLGRAWPASPSWYRADLPGVCAGLRAVRFDGAAYTYAPAPRKSSGPDLRGLFIGAQGSRGVITAAHLSASPQPEAQVTVRAHIAKGGEALLEAMFAAVRAGAQPWSASLWVSAGAGALSMTFAGVTPLVQALANLTADAVRAAAPAAEIEQAQEADSSFAGLPSDVAQVALEDTLYAPARAPSWAIASGHGHLPTLRAALAAARTTPSLGVLITQPSPTDAAALLMHSGPQPSTPSTTDAHTAAHTATVTTWRGLPWRWALDQPSPPPEEDTPAWLRRWHASPRPTA